jgi:response regulator RpfG family c-di-GMP phosphodiesterase
LPGIDQTGWPAAAEDFWLRAAPADRRRRVLIVDDEENILTSLRRLLRREPYELVTANSADQALRLMEEHPADLVISDYRMPGMTGTELLREVQTHWPETLRIILSGYSEVRAIIDAINTGAIYKFLSKPWNDEEVKLHIRRALEQYDLEMENRRMARKIAAQNERLVELNRQLKQRAADASTGLDSVQELLDLIDAGVITLDPRELIVGANQRAVELLASEAGGLIGLSAGEALPPQLYAALFEQPARGQAGQPGQLEHEGRILHWRARRIGGTDNPRGTVVTLWEDAP